MRQWIVTACAGVMAMAGIIAVAVVNGCGGGGGQAARNTPHQGGPAAMPAPGGVQSIGGLEDARPANAGVPEIDLQSVLQQSQSGGGGVSPFGQDERFIPDNVFAPGILNINSASPVQLGKLQRTPDNHSGRPLTVDFDRDGAMSQEGYEAVLRAYAERTNRSVKEAWLAEQSDPNTPVPAVVEKVDAEQRERLATPAEFTLYPGQELWVIERPNRSHIATPSTTDDYPGSATLMTRIDDTDHPGQQREVPVPLRHTDVRASIAGAISSVRVTQNYHNPFGSKIEALYIFPLPDDAAVNDFVMTIGSRSIRGVIREREQAERIYEQARARGYHASLMTQERSNIFTQRVANIEPGESVDVDVTYFHTLGFREGGYEFVFPMVIGPRFNPCGWNGVGAVPAYATGTSGQATEVQYTRPGTRSGTDISLSVEVDAGVAIESIESPSHGVIASIDPAQPTRATAKLSSGDTIPNRDFVLRYRVAGGQVKGGLITHRDERGGFFSLTLVPPSDLRYTQRGPVELVFVVDCSGSMEGEPLRLCKRAVCNALRQLRPEDSFQIIRFSDACSFMSDRPLACDEWNLRRGMDYASGLTAGGGTMMLKGLEPALELRGDWNRTRFICLLSDGLLGNEPEVLEQLKRKLGDSRIFSVGIGAAPNRTLLNAMARIGRGAAAYVANDRDADEVTNLFVERISSAAMTDLRIDWGDLNVTEVFPKRIPDLYVGRPVVLYGKFRGDGRAGSVKVSGRVGRERQTMLLPCAAPAACADARVGGSGGSALPLVWARAKITDLDEGAIGWGQRAVGAGSTSGPNKSEVRDLALKFGIISAYTSFVAVDSSERTAGAYGTSVTVPVNLPQGVRYETTVGDR